MDLNPVSKSVVFDINFFACTDVYFRKHTGLDDLSSIPFRRYQTYTTNGCVVTRNIALWLQIICIWRLGLTLKMKYLSILWNTVFSFKICLWFCKCCNLSTVESPFNSNGQSWQQYWKWGLRCLYLSRKEWIWDNRETFGWPLKIFLSILIKEGSEGHGPLPERHWTREAEMVIVSVFFSDFFSACFRG